MLKIRLLPNLDFENKKNIIINSIRPHFYSLAVEFYIGALLRRRGHKVFIILDFGTLSHWDSSHATSESAPTYYSGGIRSFIIGQLYKLIFMFAAIIGDIRILRLRSLDISRVVLEPSEIAHVNSSCERYSSQINLSKNPKRHPYYIQSVKNAKLLKVNFEYFKNKISPDLIISSHGVYVSWGIIHDLAVKNYISTLVCTSCIYNTGSAWLTNNALQKIYDDYSSYKEKNKSIPNALEFDSLKFLMNRINYKAPDIKIYYEKEFSEIKISNKWRKTYALFPNIVWDGAVDERNTIFDGVIDWSVKTIEFFRDYLTEDLLIIRLHPAEATLTKFSEKFVSILLKYIPDLYHINNIQIIGSDVSLDLYDFIKSKIDIPLIYDGNLAYEIIMLDKPLVIFSKPRYSSAQIGYELETLDEYFSFLTDHSSVLDWFKTNKSSIIKNLEDFARYYFFTTNYYLPIFSNKNYWDYNVDLNNSEIDELINQSLELTINRLSGMSNV